MLQPRRKSIRLKNYDYAQAGWYFITLCTQARQPLLGRIDEEQMYLSAYGEITRDAWYELIEHYGHIQLNEFVIMPNHIHGIIEIKTADDHSPVGVGLKPTPTDHALFEIIRAFKTFSARRINEKRHSVGSKVWQRGYYEHVIRSEKSYLMIAEYIRSNPQRWVQDAYFTHEGCE